MRGAPLVAVSGDPSTATFPKGRLAFSIPPARPPTSRSPRLTGGHFPAEDPGGPERKQFQEAVPKIIRNATTTKKLRIHPPPTGGRARLRAPLVGSFAFLLTGLSSSSGPSVGAGGSPSKPPGIAVNGAEPPFGCALTACQPSDVFPGIHAAFEGGKGTGWRAGPTAPPRGPCPLRAPSEDFTRGRPARFLMDDAGGAGSGLRRPPFGARVGPPF